MKDFSLAKWLKHSGLKACVFSVMGALAVAPSGAFGSEEPAKKVDPKKLQARKVEEKPGDAKTAPQGEGAAKPADAAAPAAPIDPNAPRGIIKPDEEVHDFGTTWVGATLKHTFKIKNDGTAPLEISKVQPGCGCTTAGPHPNKLAPGETGEFSFSLNSAKLSGPYEKAITISSNDPSNPQLKLKLKGEVKQYVNIVPSTANFGKIFGGEPQERVLKITNNTDKPLELTLEPPADSPFKFELTATEPGKAYDLKVSVTPPSEAKNLNTQVSLKTNIEGQADIQVNALATIPPRLDIQPPDVVVNDSTGAANSAPLTRLVRFTNYGKDPVKVTEATCDDPEIKLSVQERVADKEYTIQVNIPANYKIADTGRTITLKTTDKEKPSITVPVKAPAKPTTAEKPLSPAEQKVGTPMPSFTLATIDGKPAGSADLKDTVAVLNFFAPNCGFCKKQIPRMQAIAKEYQGKGVRFINVSEKMRKDFTQQEIVDILKESCKDVPEGVVAELALDMENKVGPLFGANSYPTMVLVGKSGKIEGINSGNIADLETKLKSQLNDLLEGKSLPKPTPAKTADATAEKPRPATEMVGKEAPKFTLTTLDGKQVGDYAAAKGTVLNFVAGDCGFCKKQVPTVEAIRKDYEAKGIRFVNVVQKMRKDFTQPEIVDVFKQAGSQLELALDTGNTVGQQFKAVSFPTMVIVDAKGKVDTVHVGAKPDLSDSLKKELDNLIAGKSNIGTAPAAPAVTPQPAKVTPVEVKPAPAPSGIEVKPTEKQKSE